MYPEKWKCSHCKHGPCYMTVLFKNTRPRFCPSDYDMGLTEDYEDGWRCLYQSTKEGETEINELADLKARLSEILKERDDWERLAKQLGNDNNELRSRK